MTLKGFTLASYFSLRFVGAIAGLFLLAAILIFIFDFLELVRRSGDEEGFSVLRVAFISLLRVPQLMEEVLPFAVLFGSIAAFLTLSRSLELVVTRAAGVSVWQFVAPGLFVGLAIGMLAITIYNPLAVYSRTLSDEIAAGLFSREQSFLLQTTEDVWLRQNGDDGESILHARQLLDQGERLFGVMILTFNRDGSFLERIEAEEALLDAASWQLKDATVYTTNSDPQKFDRYSVSTYLSPQEIRSSIGAPEAIAFWDLPRIVELSERAGLPAYRYSLQYQVLLSRPLLLAAMVLIAASVSLRVSRMGGIGRLIVGGIVAGFVLYVLSELAKDFGGAGLVPPVVAAWAPGVLGILMGSTILLHQEDG